MTVYFTILRWASFEYKMIFIFGWDVLSWAIFENEIRYLMCLNYVWRNLFLLLLVASSFFLSTLLFLIERCGSVCLFVFFSCSFVSAFQWVILCNHCIPWLSQRFWDLDEEFFVVVFFSSLILWIFF